jgi:hypothetical protein
MINIHYDSEKEILFLVFRSSITIQDISSVFENIKTYKQTKNQLKIYCDAKNTELEVSRSEVSEITTNAQLYINAFGKIKISVVAESPKVTAFFMVIFMNIKNESFMGEVFSTSEAAKKWMEL